MTSRNSQVCLLLDLDRRQILASFLEGRECPPVFDGEQYRRLLSAEESSLTMIELGVLVDAYGPGLLDALRWPKLKGEA